MCSLDFPVNKECFYTITRRGKIYFDSYCKQCKNAQKVAWQRNNRDKANAAGATYRRKNRDITNKKINDYYYQNKEKYNGYNRKRRALKASNGFEKYEEAEVLKLYGTNCYLCDMPIDLNASRKVGVVGWKSGLHIEHFVAIVNGGSDTIENVRPSHGWCNLTKGSK
jgi:hypothetical protein